MIRQTPAQADSRECLLELLQDASGGVIFSTLQKFQPDGPGEAHPLLSDRRNIIFIVDEAHRSRWRCLAAAPHRGRDADQPRRNAAVADGCIGGCRQCTQRS